MPNQSNAAREIALAALVLGIAGDVLLRVTPWGLNFGLWVGMIVGALFFLARRHAIVFTPGGVLMPLVMLLFASMLAWHDSSVLACLDSGAVLTALGLAALRGRSGQIAISDVLEYPLKSLRVWLSGAFGVIPLLRRDIVSQVYGPPSRNGVLRRTAIGRGLVLTTPLVLIFGGLLMGADPVFNHDITSLFAWDISDAIGHGVLFLLFGALGAGILRALLLRPWPADACAKRSPLAVGVTETTMVLGALNALFLAFVLAQLRYFFGGAQYVHATTGMDYSEYARSGFFQLVWVSVLALPLLLTLHGVLKTADNGERLRFHGLSVIMILLLYVIMDSALQRMMLYTRVYGLTELRLYTTAFMGWLALVFAWFVATVTHERRERFAFGAVVAGFVVIGGLNALDPNALIARVNIERMDHGGSFDVDYNADTLGMDAVPALVAALPRMLPDASKSVALDLLLERQDLKTRDWRGWNFARQQAWNALKGRRIILERIAGCSVEATISSEQPCEDQDADD